MKAIALEETSLILSSRPKNCVHSEDAGLAKALKDAPIVSCLFFLLLFDNIFGGRDANGSK